jgi:hypothetical protein
MNSVTEKLEEENYFTKIINLQDLLAQEYP